MLLLEKICGDDILTLELRGALHKQFCTGLPPSPIRLRSTYLLLSPSLPVINNSYLIINHTMLISQMSRQKGLKILSFLGSLWGSF